jgi:outer membrane protein
MKNCRVLLVLAALCWLAVPARAQQKIATIDLEKVFEKYYKTVQSNMSISNEAAEMEKEHTRLVESEKKHETDWQALFDRSNDQALSADERAKSSKEAESKYADLATEKQSIQEFDRVAMSRLQEKKRQKRDDIVKEIEGVLNADAKQAGFAMVLDISGLSANMAPVVLYNDGKYDMTDQLIRELNATAPPGALDTNSPPATSSTH